MSNNGLKLWQESINEYCSRNNSKYTVPKKGTTNYAEIKKIYDKKRGNVNKKSNKKCKCQCPSNAKNKSS